MNVTERHCLLNRDKLIARLERKSVHDSTLGCRVWTGATVNKGYGKIAVTFDGHKTFLLTHRLSLLLFTGKSLEGLQADHRCCNKLCLNPDHLVACFPTDNRTLQVLRRGEPDEDIVDDPDKDIPYPWPGEPVVKYSRCPF